MPKLECTVPVFIVKTAKGGANEVARACVRACVRVQVGMRVFWECSDPQEIKHRGVK